VIQLLSTKSLTLLRKKVSTQSMCGICIYLQYFYVDNHNMKDKSHPVKRKYCNGKCIDLLLVVVFLQSRFETKFRLTKVTCSFSQNNTNVRMQT